MGNGLDKLRLEAVHGHAPSLDDASARIADAPPPCNLEKTPNVTPSSTGTPALDCT